MKLTFWGASRQVTGSMYLLELRDDYKILIDCGSDLDREVDYSQETSHQSFFPFDAPQVNLVLLTHAHIDHSGNIPLLYQEGYEGQVLCTSPTAELSELLLIDSANLNAQKLKKAQGESRKKQKKMDRLVKRGDIYLEAQVREAVSQFVTVQFNRRFKIHETAYVTFIPAGHLLGAAHILLEVTEDGKTKKILFSGDLGRRNYPLHIDPERVPQVDYLLCESTYGSRLHEDTQPPEDALADVIYRSCIEKPGRLIIPSFSVGRTQALLFTLNKLYNRPDFEPIKVFSDSPLAYASTQVYQRNLKQLNAEAKAFQAENDTLFDFDNLIYIRSEKDSKAISNHHEPCIIISSSGMVQGGRVEQHVAANIGNPYCTILLIGFCAEGTLGWRLLNGQTTIRIKDREEKVLAAVEKIDVFSGHGDQADLLNFVKYQQSDKLQKLFLIHGELESMEIFKEKLRNEGYPQVEIPERGQSFEL
jgi:metallo-beta-lactamase family protein